MRLKVKPLLTIKGVMGNNADLEMEMEYATIRGLLVELSSKYGEDFRDEFLDPETLEIKRHYLLLVNGRHYLDLPDRLDTRLSEGDLLVLSPPLAGG